MFSFLFQGALFDVVLDRLSSSEDAVGGVCSVRSYLGILPAKGAGSAPGASRAPPAPLEPLSFLAARGVLCRRLRRRFRGGACPAVSKDHLFGGPRPCSRTSSRQPFVLLASLGRPLRRRRPLPFLAPVGSLVSSPRQDHSFFGRRGPSCGTVSGGVSLRGRVRRRR